MTLAFLASLPVVKACSWRGERFWGSGKAVAAGLTICAGISMLLLEKTKPIKINPDNIFELFEAPETCDKAKELEVYIKNMDCLQRSCKGYPKYFEMGEGMIIHQLILSLHFEHTFSSAADVCSSGRGSLKPRKIEQCVSSNVWLKEGIQ
ncbi:hypothetical protein VP01_2897g2, partial [Puccinia sorghi]